jgi:hypothetical protein
LSRECEGIENASRARARGISEMTARTRDGGGMRDVGDVRSSQTGEMDPEKIAQEIYPILRFRDRVVKAINKALDKVQIASRARFLSREC